LMRLTRYWHTSVIGLAMTVAACNSELPDSPSGLRCDANRTPPCVHGFVCIDAICVHPSQVPDGGLPPQSSTAALEPGSDAAVGGMTAEAPSATGAVPPNTPTGETPADMTDDNEPETTS